MRAALRSGAFWLFVLAVCALVFGLIGRESDRQRAACGARGGQLRPGLGPYGYVCEVK